MRFPARLLVRLVLVLLAGGCGKEASATNKSTTPTGTVTSTAPHPPLPVDPIGVSSGTTSSQSILDQVTLDILEVDAPSGVGTAVGTSLALRSVGLKIVVRNNHEDLWLLVEPSRFSVETETGKSSPALFSSSKEPAMGTLYLKSGESTEGWISFEVPAAAERLTLKSTLRTPSIYVPVAL
jgi:hypothetical protein